VLTATAFGRTVGLQVDDIDAIRPVLPYWWGADRPPSHEPERVWPIADVTHAEAVISELELWVAEHAAGLVFVHAGVVAVDGKALLLPGRSLTGKSTLTRALLQAGAAYGSDEYAVLRPDGRVQAYPRPLALRDDPRRRVSAAELGAQSFEGALPVAAVAVLQFVPDATWDVEPISPATAVLRLLDNTVCAASRPDDALAAVTALAADVVAVEGVRGAASDAATALLELL
jgi:hypothetical protein